MGTRGGQEREGGERERESREARKTGEEKGYLGSADGGVEHVVGPQRAGVGEVRLHESVLLGVALEMHRPVAILHSRTTRMHEEGDV